MSLLHSIGSAGIYTCCPSPTTAVLGLGPDLPWVDEPSPGNLGLSTGMFLACLSLLIPAFSLLHSPPCLSIRLLPVYNAPLPRSAVVSTLRRHFSLWWHLLAFGENMSSQVQKSQHRTHRFGVTFEPRTFSAHNHSTSELLRTL